VLRHLASRGTRSRSNIHEDYMIPAYLGMDFRVDRGASIAASSRKTPGTRLSRREVGGREPVRDDGQDLQWGPVLSGDMS